jgi:hypothetical protein
MNFFIGRTYIKAIGELIGRKDLRSIRRWCNKNHLQIYKDYSGEFVIENDLELAFEKPLILKLKEKYGNAWIDYYQAYKKNELINMLEFGCDIKNVKSDYIPKGQFAARIIRKSA